MNRYLFLSVVLFTCFFFTNGYSQMPINLFSYSKSDLKESKKMDIPRKVLDRYFVIRNDKDSTIKKDSLDLQINLWKEALSKSLEEVDPYLAYYEYLIIDTLKDRVNTLRQQIVDTIAASPYPGMAIKNNKIIIELKFYASQLDTLSKGFKAVNRVAGTPKISSRFFASRNRYEASLLYQKYGTRFLQFGQNISFYGWENRGSINPEIVSLFAGPIRLAVNTIVSSNADNGSSDDTEGAKLRTLTGNGGNLILSAYYPIFHTSTKNVNIISQFSPKFAAEIPVLGSPFKSDTIFGNMSFGVDLNLSVGLDIFGKSSLYYYARPAYVLGSDPYKVALQLDGNNFFLMQQTVGIDIPNIGRIGFALPPVTNVKSLKTETFLLSFQVSPQNVLK